MVTTSGFAFALAVLLDITLLLFILAAISLVVTALRFKTAVMGDAKRLYVRPLQAVKNLAATGKGIAQQEGVRVKHISAVVKTAAGHVRVTATGLKEVATSIPVADMKSSVADLKAQAANAQNAVKILNLVSQFARVSGKQGQPEK